MAPDPLFSLTLLGGFALTRKGIPSHVAYEKGRALLAFLATEPHRVCTRTRLAQLFWPHLGREAALTNLRQVLHDLKRAMDAGNGVSPLQVDRQVVRLIADGSISVDVTEATRSTGTCPSAPFSPQCGNCLGKMEGDIDRYQGEFLAGMALPECAEFEEWLGTQREALHLSMLNRVIRLSDCHERMGTHDKAAAYALRGLDMEPWNEQLLLRAMRLLISAHQASAALAAYDRVERTLQRDLGVSPGPEATMMADQIRRGDRTHIPLARTEPESPAPEGWIRRQITALCIELVPTNALADTDQLLSILAQPRATCAEIIKAHAGHLVPLHGRALLGYFGYPQATEHAVKLALQVAWQLTHTGFSGVQARVGLHTGEVISGGSPPSPDLTGELTETAMGIRQLANPGEIRLSPATHRLVQGFYECTERGAAPLPGSHQCMDTFTVVAPVANRLVSAASGLTALTPLTGRADEVALLLASWQSVRRGHPQFLLLTGEAGMGKSRLLLPLKEALNPQDSTLIEMRCSQDAQDSPYSPLVTWLHQRLLFVPEESELARFQKLAHHIHAHTPETASTTIPLLAHLLGVPIQAPYALPVVTQAELRDRLCALLIEQLQHLARHSPVLLILEDLHWADPSTLEVLNMLVARASVPKVLVVFTARPEFSPAWRSDAVRTLALKPLDATQTTALVRHIAATLDAKTVASAVAKSDGIPLFAESLAHDLEVGCLREIPQTLEDLLMSRLDGLGDARPIAQLAATIGREFDLTLLARVLRCEEASLRDKLRRLQRADIVIPVEQGRFKFRHALIRDAAYQSQPKKEREAAHHAIALQLASGPQTDIRPEWLAQHWSASGAFRQAASCWLRAGQLASTQSASQEALTHYRSGLQVVSSLPDDERVELELALLIGLGATACATQGYASLEGSEAYARAVELSERHQDNTDMFPGFWGLWASASSRVGHSHALTIARRLIRLAQRTSDPVYVQQAHFATGDTLFWRGDFASAKTHLERALNLYRVDQHARHVSVFGEDAGVTARAYLSWVLAALGDAEAAQAHSQASLDLSRQLAHPFSQGYACTFAAILACRHNRVDRAARLAQEAQILAHRYGFPLWEIGAKMVFGWVEAQQGHRHGIQTLREAHQAAEQTMRGVSVLVISLLADAHFALGQFEAAVSSATEAITLGKLIGDAHDEPGLRLLRGQARLRIHPEDRTAAIDDFEQGLALAEQQQARPRWEALSAALHSATLPSP